MFSNLWTNGSLSNVDIRKCYQRLICFIAVTLASRADGGSAKTASVLESLALQKYKE